MDKKLLCPKMDVVFHALFREKNIDDLSNFLSAILKEDVKVTTIDKNRYVDIGTSNEKLGIMDLRAELKGNEQCNIEIQLNYYSDMKKRMLYYWSDNYKRQLKTGKGYNSLQKTISILILDYTLDILNDFEDVGIKWQIRDELTGKKVLTEDLEIVILELPKVMKLYNMCPNNKAYQWLMFLDNPNSKEVGAIMKENKEIKSIADTLEQVSGDERLRRIAELKEKAILDEKAALDYATEKGIAEGFEQGRAKGRAEGHAEGLTEGREEGRNTLISNMFKNGATIESLEKLTGLDKFKLNEILKHS